MSKPNLKSLSPMDFSKMTPARDEIIAKAPADPVPHTKSYVPNIIAAALHPKAQYLKVSKIVDETDDMKSYYLEPDTENGTDALAYFSAGQYISIELEIGSKKLTRPYSLSSSPKETLDGYYMLTIKRVNDGLASQYILDNWTVGTKVKASAPLGTFTYEPLRDAKTVIGVAGGSGITPFRSLAKAIADGDEDASLILLYGSRTLKDACFQNELKELEKNCDRFRLINVLSEENADGCESGFITAELIKSVAPAGDYSIFLCGPQAMYAFVDEQIATLGLRRKFIRHELFGEFFNPEKQADYPGNVPENVKIKVSIAGESREITASTNISILRTLEDNGIKAPSHCRSGECGFCHSRLVKGEIYTPKSVDGRREADLIYGYIHPCCSFPVSDVEIEVSP